MKIYYGLNHSFPFREAALTIGNFDGVHLGHQALLKNLRKDAKTQGLPTVLMTFEPMAKEFFAKLKGQTPPYRIAPLLDKIHLLQNSGAVDYLIVIDFNQEVAGIEAFDFVEKILLEKLHTRYLLIGDDFKFGAGRRGNAQFLEHYPEIITRQLSSVCAADIRISSSVIREALLAGNFPLAERYLGHDYFLSGEVCRGQGLGKTINCPTANINLNHHFFPLHGVYVVNVKGPFGEKRGAASFGTNPTVTSDPAPKFEVHILDFAGDLYGDTLEVTFKAKIRDELKFSNLELLERQIEDDIRFARAWK